MDQKGEERAVDEISSNSKRTRASDLQLVIHSPVVIELGLPNILGKRHHPEVYEQRNAGNSLGGNGSRGHFQDQVENTREQADLKMPTLLKRFKLCSPANYQRRLPQ